MTFYPLW